MASTRTQNASGFDRGTTGTWLARVRGEYLEMPGLSLTDRQAQRLWGLEPAACRAVLDALIAAGFLRRGPNGSYVRAHG